MSVPFTMVVTLFIRPECRDEYLVALREVLVPAREKPGCVFIHANEASDEPGRIVLFERWRDLDEYTDEILRRAYFQRYLSLTEAMYAAPRVVVGLNPIEAPQ